MRPQVWEDILSWEVGDVWRGELHLHLALLQLPLSFCPRRSLPLKEMGGRHLGHWWSTTTQRPQIPADRMQSILPEGSPVWLPDNLPQRNLRPRPWVFAGVRLPGPDSRSPSQTQTVPGSRQRSWGCGRSEPSERWEDRWYRGDTSGWYWNISDQRPQGTLQWWPAAPSPCPSPHSEVSFECPECGARFPRNASMRTHFRAKHKGLQYPYNYNPYTSTSSSTTSTSITSTERESQPYQCELCGRGFSVCESLKVHVQSVHQARRFPCSQCSGTFSQSSSLASHVKSQHEKVKEKCQFCPSEYSSRGGLKLHKRNVHGVSR